MYRILIIDDEQVVREGISRNINWGAVGFELVAACRDGREGMEKVSKLKPDVVISDICMPFVDGLELAGAIADELPRTKTILLTGYDEFEYAKEAVKLKVHDFLLKPITADELTEMLQKLRTQLDAERNRRQKIERLQEQLRAALPVYRERFLNRLVDAGGHGPAAEGPAAQTAEAHGHALRGRGQDVQRTLELLGLDLPGPEYVTLICDIDPSLSEAADGDHLSGIALQNILSELADSTQDVVSFSTSAEQAVAVISVEGAEAALPRALETAERVSESAQREIGRTISVGIGSVASGLNQLPQSYQEAQTALEHRFVLGPNQIITIHQVRGDNVLTETPVQSDPRDRYIRAIKAGMPREARTALVGVINALRQAGEDLDYCHVVMHRLLADTISSLDTIGLDYRLLSAIGRNPFERLAGSKTLDEMQRWFVEILDEAHRLREGRQADHSRVKALAAEEFIHKHYMDPDLSLRNVCRSLAVSKSYLSSVFKAYSGMTLVEYLTELRMEKAQLLLRSGDAKIYEVAEAVGYRDAHYFSLTFKKQIGQSPTEFRERSGGPNENKSIAESTSVTT